MKGLDWELVRNAITLMNFLGTIGIALWAWLRGPSEANTKAIEEQRGDIEEIRRDTSERLLAIENRLPFIPTVNELGSLTADVRAMKATHDAFQREMHGMRESLSRIEDFLLSNKAR